jgi:hypothetical protein
MPRPVMLAGLLGAAVGVPYVADNASDWQKQLQGTGAPVQTVSNQYPTTPTFNIPPRMNPASPGDHIYSSPAPLEGIPTYSLAEVLRMDVSKEWVYSRWARKSTGLAEPELFGIRVPLVSGTRMTDVAGSLTYYFDLQGQVQKIRLVGKTADTSELANLLTSRFGLQPATPMFAGEQAFRVEDQGVIESELVTRPDSVLWTTSPHNSFSVELELNRPGSGRYVERPVPKLQGIETPATPPPPVVGDTSPPATPMFPGESVVPSAEPAAPAPKAEVKPPAETPAPKKQAPSHMRWPG